MEMRKYETPPKELRSEFLMVGFQFYELDFLAFISRYCCQITHAIPKATITMDTIFICVCVLITTQRSPDLVPFASHFWLIRRSLGWKLEKLVINVRLSGGISMLREAKHLLNKRLVLSGNSKTGRSRLLRELSYALQHLIGFLYRVNAGNRET
jgi:hypothetical protein